jgi:type IV secretory pathway protease TraF
VKLTPTQIGGVQAKDGQKVMVTSNGVPVAGDPMGLRLQPDQKIELRLP